MLHVRKCSLPPAALLRRYSEDASHASGSGNANADANSNANANAGAYTDCFAARVRGHWRLEDCVFAFYTTWLFKLERVILAALVARPSTDASARAVANGSSDAFAAWTVEARARDQILLCDMAGRTRSWLMTEQTIADAVPETVLYFGSAVLPARSTEGKTGFGMGLLLPLHRLYARALLGAARSRLTRQR